MVFDSTSARAGKILSPQASDSDDGVEKASNVHDLDYWRTRALLAEDAVNELSQVVVVAEERLQWMREIGETLARRREPQDAINLLLDRAVRLVDGRLGALYLRSDHEPDYIIARTLIGERLEEIRLRIGEGLAGVCAETKRVVNVKDARRDPRWRYAFDELTGAHTGPVICVPLADSYGNLMGVVQVINKRTGPYFTLEDQDMLVSIASSISLLLENFRYYFEQVASNFELTEARDNLEERLRQLDALSHLQHRLSSTVTRFEEVDEVAKATLALLNVDGVAVTYMDEAVTTTYLGLAGRPGVVRPTNRNTPLFRHALSTREPWIVHADDPAWGTNLFLDDEAVESYLSVPIYAKEQLLGLLEIVVLPVRGRRFDQGDAKLLSLIAGQLARSLVVLRERDRRERDGRVAALGAMLSGVMHDLKTPLTISLGYLQLMERTEVPERRHFYSAAIKRQFEDIRAMTGELVAYARGEIMLYERTVHLTILGHELLEWLRHEFAESASEVEVHLQSHGSLRLDEGKLKRIIFNLARNANEAMADHAGVFSVRFQRDGDMLHVCCADTGPGIPPHLLRQVFEPFVSSRKGARSGLGLSIVQRLAQELGGSIEIVSEPMVGTKFEIRVPWKDVPAEEDEDPAHT